MSTRAASLGVLPSSGQRLPGIEGLRAIAAGSVLVYHAWLYSPGNPEPDLGRFLDTLMADLAYGVVLFFTLSGFLLYRPFAASILRVERMPDIRRYLRNRGLRILPAYWVILFICAVVLGSVLFRDHSLQLVNGRLLNPALLLAAGLFLPYYYPDTLLTGIGPAWSLSVELVFYLALPLLGLLGLAVARGRRTRGGRRWAALAPAFLILVIGLTGKAIAAFLIPASAQYDGWEANWHSVLERSFWCQADLFAFGMGLAVIRIDAEDGLLHLPRGWRTAVVGAILAAALVVVKFGEGQLSYSLYNTLVAAGSALLLALVVLPGQEARRTLLLRFLESPPFVAAGVASYSVFLWHEPLIRWLDGKGVGIAGAAGFVLNLVLAVAIIGVASAITYRFVEAPALRFKFAVRRGPRQAMIPAPDIHSAP
jgi:peptidoglycan/LPS O-acetylase OafA/YrhL